MVHSPVLEWYLSPLPRWIDETGADGDASFA
jgi:hypothetical protein